MNILILQLCFFFFKLCLYAQKIVGKMIRFSILRMVFEKTLVTISILFISSKTITVRTFNFHQILANIIYFIYIILY